MGNFGCGCTQARPVNGLYMWGYVVILNRLLVHHLSLMYPIPRVADLFSKLASGKKPSLNWI